MGDRARRIDTKIWDRREHFEFFREFGYPYWGITTDIDITALRHTLKERSVSFTVGLVYVLLRAANAVPEFRQRIHEDGVVEYEGVDAGLTVLSQGEMFRFATLPYTEDFGRFASEGATRIEAAQAATTFSRNVDRDDMLYMSALPWFSFSAFLHPLPLSRLDSVPRLAWGRFEETEQGLKLPLNVQAHHALIDGLHIARFLSQVEKLAQEADMIPCRGASASIDARDETGADP